MENNYPALTERIFSLGTLSVIGEMPAGLSMVAFASHECGATDFSTYLATFEPGARIPYHTHTCSEAVTILQGQARVQVEGRTYWIGPLDCIHFPPGTSHQLINIDSQRDLVVHCAYASPRPQRTITQNDFPIQDRGLQDPIEGDPETIVRFGNPSVYELSTGAFFHDLFAGRFGAIGICGGLGRFSPGASLPCHTHEYDESITIIEGAAVCLVEGRRYQLTAYDTVFIPKGKPHRFLNLSKLNMAMIWVYAGDEPDRTIVDTSLCSQLPHSP
jgi:quercetin dioxygenase-like cupin family protein